MLATYLKDKMDSIVQLQPNESRRKCLLDVLVPLVNMVNCISRAEFAICVCFLGSEIRVPAVLCDHG